MDETRKLVLLIDDDDVDNLLHGMVISEINFANDIIIFKSCEDALSYLQKAGRGEEEIPDMILLDIFMPLSDGFEFLNDYDKLPDCIKNNTKIVVITHSIDEKDKIKSEANRYVDYFIEKPLTVEKLELIAEAMV